MRFFPDLNENVHFHFNQGNPEIKYFNCSNYKGNRGTCNCVGMIEIPTVLPLPISEVSVNTRKGVVVNYASCELAV